MANILVRGLDDDVKHRLRVAAAQNGRSMEAEARAILTEAMATTAPDVKEGSLFDRMHAVARRHLADVDDEFIEEWIASLERDRREPLPPPIEFDDSYFEGLDEPTDPR